MRPIRLLVASFAFSSLWGAGTTVRAQEVPTSRCGLLLQDAWSAVSEAYLDENFRGVDWEGLQPRPGTECGTDEAHLHVRRLLDRLGDPAVRLVPAAEVEAFIAEMTLGATSGVGLRELLSVDVDERTGLLTVVTPVPDGPAAQAGIRTGDVIEAIDGIRSDTMDLALAMAALRGAPGTAVDVQIRRGNQVQVHRLRRARSIQHTAEWRQWKGSTGTPFAYVRLPDFSEGSAAVLKVAVAEAEASGVRGLVLDLRDNPGGLVGELVAAAELFLPRTAPIARLRSRGRADTLLVASAGPATTAPLIVLVNRGSASAAEALAGALQANGRATVVGQRTFGKGLAHFATQLSDGSLVMVPSGRLSTPGGRDILAEGIAPDFELPTPSLNTLLPDLGRDPLVAEAFRIIETAIPPDAATLADSLAIERTALDYIQGWYSGDGERMRRAVHPQLVKRIYLRRSGQADSMAAVNGTELVEQTRQGYGRDEDTVRTEVTILDIFKNAASVRVDAGRWVDYLHMARTERGWQIINVLWELR